jgi:hypothetical protein
MCALSEPTRRAARGLIYPNKPLDRVQHAGPQHGNRLRLSHVRDVGLGSFAEMRGSRRRVRSTLRSGHRSAPKQRPVRANRPNVSSTCRAAATDVHRRASLSLVSATGLRRITNYLNELEAWTF